MSRRRGGRTWPLSVERGRAALIVVQQWGTVDELHGRDPFAGGEVGEPRLLWCEPVDTAVVLGSRQSPDLLDLAAIELDRPERFFVANVDRNVFAEES